MKKNLAILPLVLSSILLGGCPANNTKAKLDFGTYADNTYRSIKHPDLVELVTKKKSFAIVVSPEKASCVCWHDFKLILEDYIVKEHILIYEINYKDFFDVEGNQLNTYGVEIHSSEETFAIFDKGELRCAEVYDANKAMFKQSSVFKSYMDTNIEKPSMYFVDMDDVDELFNSGKDATIYYARSNCPDCQYVENNFLNTYDFKDNILYVVDCERIGVREYENGSLTPESATKWQQFKNDYGLSYYYDEESEQYVGKEHYGFDKGYVPTFQTIKKEADMNYLESIHASSVYFNDTVEDVDGDYKVTNSFYSEERKEYLPYLEGVEHQVLKGMSLSRDQVSVVEYQGTEYVSWLKTDAAKYHNALLKAFLDWSLPRSDARLK